MLQRPGRLVLVVSLAIFCLAILPLAIGDPASPITVSDQATPSPVTSGQEITYTITVVNTAGSKITNVVMTDQLNGVGGEGVPPQLQITSTRGSCTQSTTLVTCNAGTIEGGGSWFVTIRGQVTAAGGTVINNTASISGTHTAQNFTTTVTTSTQVNSGGGTSLPDLTISKNGPTSVNTSSPMTYTLTVNNIGTANATNVKVVDTVPGGLTAISASGTSLFNCSVSGLTVTCVGGAVNAGANATITINATSPSTAGSITNTASVDPDNTIPESNELNNTSALVNTQVNSTPPPPAPFTISVADNPDPVVPGATLTYKILVTNTSGQRADDVVVTDGTQGLVASSITVNQVVTNGTIGNTGGCTIAAPQAQCSVRTLQPGGTISMTVAGSVIASAGSTIIDTGTVTGNINHVGVSVTNTQLTTVKPAYDFTVTLADNPDPVCARSWPGAAPAPLVCRGGLTYTFVVGNSGIQDAAGVALRFPLPPDTKLEQSTAPAAWGCSVDPNNVFTCTSIPVAHESTTTFSINLLAPATTGTITATATVDPNNAIFESDETNNTATQTTQVITGIDLTIAKTDAIDPIATSGTETYTITVNNLGTQDATNIRVRDTLPANTIFRDAIADPNHNFTCSPNGNIVECVGGAIKGTASNNDPAAGGLAANPPDTATILIRIFAQPFAGTMHNEARVDPLGEIAEANETNNIATQDTVVDSFVSGHGAFNQLTITKTQTSPDKTNTARNAKVTWLIDVGNNGTDTAVGVTVRDFLPAGARYIQATGTNKFNCSQVSNYINCIGGEIGSLAHATITLTAFAPDTPGTYVNQAVVDPDNTIPEGDELDNQAFETTVVNNGGAGPFYELSVVKTQVSPANPVARNAVVTYNLLVKNTGSDPVIGVKVRDTLPPAFRYISATGTNQFVCAQSAGVVDCVGGQLDGVTGTANITVTAFAPDTAGTYTNQALVDPDNTIPEGDELNNQSQFATIVQNGGNGPFNDLTIVVTGPTVAAPDSVISYLLTVNNLGSDPASNVAVRDPLPAGTTFVSAADPSASGAFNCNAVNNVVNCTGATIAPGIPHTISLTLKTPHSLGNITNTATVDPDNTIPEGDETNNTSSQTTAINSPIDLTITKDGPTTASQSDVTDYTITVTNTKADGTGAPAFGVVMVDPLPVGLIPLATDLGSGNNWACTIDQNPINDVRCVGDLGPGDSVTIKITVFITAEDGRSLDNVACVDPDNLIVESNELNNCSDHGTFVAPPPKNSPDLFVSKSVDKTSTTAGATLTYNINISNNGTAKAKSPLTLTDPLSSNLTFGNVTATNSWTCTQAAGTVTCHDGGSGLDVGESAKITIVATVNDNVTSSISNTATAAPALGDCTDPSTCEDETATHIASNTSTVVTSIGGSGYDLFVGAITDSPDPVAPGAALKYTIAAGNAGTQDAHNVHMEVDVPSSGVVFVGAAGSNGWTCDGPMSNKLDCHGDLPGGGTTTIIINFTTLLATPPPTSISLTATIDPTNAFTELDETNNTKTEVTTINGSACSSCIDLVAAQLVADPDPANTGDTVHVTFDIVNAGDEPTALDTTSQDLLELDVSAFGSFDSASPSSSNPGVTCTSNYSSLFGIQFNNIHCRGNLGPHEGVTIKLDVPNVGGGATSLLLTGKADPGGHVTESNTGNNNLTNSVVIH